MLRFSPSPVIDHPLTRCRMSSIEAYNLESIRVRRGGNQLVLEPTRATSQYRWRMNVEADNAQRARVEEFQRAHRIELVTMLFTDVVGSTELKQRLGDRAGMTGRIRA